MEYLDIQLKGIDHSGEEKTYKLSDFKGEKVVLYFYPKDFTPGCTQEACDFRDNLKRLTSKAVVIGVSSDNLESHKKFREKEDLNFILLSDTDHKLAEAFDVWQEKSNGHTVMNRSTFILDKEGNIEHEWRNVKVEGHVDEILDYILK